MKLRVVWTSARRGRDKEPAIGALSEGYVKRLSRFVTTETAVAESESALVAGARAGGGRTAPVLVLLHAGGRQYTSEEFAEFLDEQRSRGTQTLIFGIGPADGFSPAALKSANHVLSLGKMTLPHELARVVLLEQLYRAFTILSGHPYHTGH